MLHVYSSYTTLSSPYTIMLYHRQLNKLIHWYNRVTAITQGTETVTTLSSVDSVSPSSHISMFIGNVD